MDLGAHSLATVMIAMRLYEEFSVEISVSELRDSSSVDLIAKAIRDKEVRSDEHVRPSFSSPPLGTVR